MPRHTPGDDFPPWMHPGIAMSCCSWGFVADFSASLIIISKYVEMSSLEHQDEGRSLPMGQAQMSVSFHSWLQQQGCTRHSQGAKSQPYQILGAARAPAFSQHLHFWWITPFCSQRLPSLWLPLSQTSPCSLPPTPAPLCPQLVLFGLNPAEIWMLLLFLSLALNRGC